jgi:putative ABC transport system ATP-binding protein
VPWNHGCVSGIGISVEGLTHRYRAPGGEVIALDDVHLDIPAGCYASVTGASGAGKSTLLAVLGGLEPPRAGNVVVGGHDLHRLDRNELAAYRRDTVGFVFQHFGLLDSLTALENVALACSLNRVRARAGRQRATELLDAVGLADRRDHLSTTLSGGERQRVAIARALANEPGLVLADEPTGNLDEETAEPVVQLLEALPATRGCTVLVVTHDRRLAARAARHVHLVDGRVAADDGPAHAAVPGPAPT